MRKRHQQSRCRFFLGKYPPPKQKFKKRETIDSEKMSPHPPTNLAAQSKTDHPLAHLRGYKVGCGKGNAVDASN